MRVCLIVEGAYPYVTGGVSSWIQDIITHFSQVEFVVQTLVVDRHGRQPFAYEIPPNVVEIREAYLQDEDYGAAPRKIRLNRQEREAFKSLFYGEQVQWEAVFHYFATHDVSINAFLSSEAFFQMSLSYYQSHYVEVVFSDFLWTMRSIFLPLLSVLRTPLPEADLYHTISTGYAGVLASMAKVRYHKPMLLSEHGIYTREREEEIIRADWVKGIYKELWIQTFQKYSRCCYQYADRVTALFEQARQLQIEFGCPEGKTQVVRNGIQPEQYADAPGKDPDDGYINVGAVLRVTPIKDVKTMISAFAAAKREVPNLKLWIMGPEDENPEYAAQCHEMVSVYQVPDVVFTGRIPVKAYIGKMDFLLLTSLSEGQPLVILEGFSARKPFICTNVGNCRGMLEGEADDLGDAGIVVPVMNVKKLREAIVYLAEHPQERARMGEIGYERTKRYYRIEDVYSSFDRLYTALGGEGGN